VAIGDIYLLRDKQRALYGTEIENTYFYRGTGTGLSIQLAEAFEDVMLPAICALQPTDYVHYALVVQSLFDPTDFYTNNISQLGTWQVETSAPYTAVNFTLRTPTRAIRPGSKRVGPVPENAVQNGVLIDPTYLANVDALRGLLDNTIAPTAAPTATFEPIVVKRIRVGTPPNATYRLPTSFGEAVFAPVTNVFTTTLISHQVSRQRVN
jgi:hypothetical protein